MSNEVQELLDRYADALRARDLDAVMSCYTEDAVVAAQGAPTVTGAAVRELYGQILAALTLDIAFTVESTIEGGDGTVAVFTHSAGKQTEVGSEASSPESNREAFVMIPTTDGLAVSRYLFNVAG